MTPQDIHGKEITAGCRVVWKEHGQEHTGVVEYDAKYTTQLKCGGRSVHNIFECSDWIEVV